MILIRCDFLHPRRHDDITNLIFLLFFYFLFFTFAPSLLLEHRIRFDLKFTRLHQWQITNCSVNRLLDCKLTNVTKKDQSDFGFFYFFANSLSVPCLSGETSPPSHRSPSSLFLFLSRSISHIRAATPSSTADSIP